MKQEISLREVNQHLSRYISAVQNGEEIIITKRGKPVARLLSVDDENAVDKERLDTWDELKSTSTRLDIGRFDRDSCYER